LQHTLEWKAMLHNHIVWAFFAFKISIFPVATFLTGYVLIFSSAHYSNPVLNRVKENYWAAPMRSPGEDEFLVIDSSIRLRYDAALLRKARSQYIASYNEFEKYQNDWKQLDQKEHGIYDTVWWKVIDEREYIQKQKHDLYRKHILTMNENYEKTLRTLDRIENERVKKTKLFTELLEHTLRMHIKFSLYLKLFPSAERMLHRYHNLTDVSGDWIFYYFRYQCRLALYHDALKMGQDEATLRMIRKNKNEDRLKAVLLHYGKESYEFRFVAEKIRLEELGKPVADPY